MHCFSPYHGGEKLDDWNSHPDMREVRAPQQGADWMTETVIPMTLHLLTVGHTVIRGSPRVTWADMHICFFRSARFLLSSWLITF